VIDPRIRRLVEAAKAWLKEADRRGLTRDDFKGVAGLLWDAAEAFREDEEKK